MDQEKHKERHILLHRMFDELIADFISNTGGLPSRTSLMELMDWSHKQTEDPDHEEPDKPDEDPCETCEDGGCGK